MADDDYTYTPPARRGFDTGEYIINIPPGGADTLVAPPMQRALEEEIIPAARGAGNALTLGNLPRAVGAANYMLGNDPSYSAGVDRYVKADEEAARRSPWAYGAGSLSTGVLGGLGLARAGVTAVPYMASRLGRTMTSIGEAGALGGIYGAGNTYTGKPEDYVANAGLGAVYGAPFGVLGMGTGAAGEGVYRGMASTRGIPARLAEAGATDAPGLREIIAGARGSRANLADAGPAMLGTAQGAVLDPFRPGAAELINNLRLRNESVGPTLTGGVNRILGPMERPTRIQADVIQPQIDALSPHYDALYRQAKAVDTTPIAHWLESKMTDATGEAYNALRRVRGELDLRGAPGTLDPFAGKLGNLRSDIKATLRQDKDTPGGTLKSDVRGLLKEADRRMTETLENSVPGIKHLDSIRAELGSQERALQPNSPGYRVFSKTQSGFIHPDDLRDIMTEAARPKGTAGPSLEPYRLQQATRADLDRRVTTGRNNLLDLENTLAGVNREKLGIMSTPQQAADIANLVRNERIGRDTDTAVRLGSQTATRQASQKALDVQAGKLPLELTMTGAVTRGASWLKDQLFQAQAAAQRDRIAGFMASMNPAEVQAAARQLLAVQPERNMRAALVRSIMQGGGRGAQAGFVPKDYRTE